LSRAKYIVFDERKVIVFPEMMEHAAIARKFENWKPTSAGFVSFGVDADGEVQLSGYGESVSLRLKSVPDDTHLLTRLCRGLF
jgi:hypothetical protein